MNDIGSFNGCRRYIADLLSLNRIILNLEFKMGSEKKCTFDKLTNFYKGRFGDSAIMVFKINLWTMLNDDKNFKTKEPHFFAESSLAMMKSSLFVLWWLNDMSLSHPVWHFDSSSNIVLTLIRTAHWEDIALVSGNGTMQFPLISSRMLIDQIDYQFRNRK